MINTKVRIALTFSGGGYKAAAFNLGVLTYLGRVKIHDTSLLDQVCVLSTVSGGTITGAVYAIAIKSGRALPEVFNQLYSFMASEDLVSLALNELILDENWNASRNRSLINAVANVYDKYLFEGATFGILLDDDPEVHLKHVAFNATEFSNALPFRFQCSEQILAPQDGEPGRGVVGNYKYHIPLNLAAKIRMADVLAASSCFPGGFEPLSFPDDFNLADPGDLRNLGPQQIYPVLLMDGGIVDNQGIGSVLLAENRIKRNLADLSDGTNAERSIDLIMVSDVATPEMERLKPLPPKDMGFIRRLTPKRILGTNFCLLLLSGALIFESCKWHSIVLACFASSLFTMAVLVFLVARFMRSLPLKLGVPTPFMRPIGKILKLGMGVYENLLFARLQSLLKMTNDVFLKHIRRLNYHQIFNDESWKNRRIMNAIYELKNDNARIQGKVDAGMLTYDLMPSETMRLVAKLASAMGTTLWFTKEDLTADIDTKRNKLDCIIACGQFTLCWNLLEYIGKLKKDRANTTERHQYIIDTEQQLTSDWQKFKGDPFWLLDEYLESGRSKV